MGRRDGGHLLLRRKTVGHNFSAEQEYFVAYSSVDHGKTVTDTAPASVVAQGLVLTYEFKAIQTVLCGNVRVMGVS